MKNKVQDKSFGKTQDKQPVGRGKEELKGTIHPYIYYEFGSEFQKRTAISSLKTFLKGWEEFYKLSNKKTKIKIYY